MVPPEMRQQPHVSFTQIDHYLRCPLKYRFTYMDHLEPEFVPAALAFGSGIPGAAFLFRGRVYELRGILAAPRRTLSGYRVYRPETVDLLGFVSRARRLV